MFELNKGRILKVGKNIQKRRRAIAIALRERLYGQPRWNNALMSALLLCCVALYAVLLLRTAWMNDDAFITMRTIDNFFNGYGLRWNIHERVQTYTHPLWMLVVLTAGWMHRDLHLTPIILNMCFAFSAMAILAFKISRSHIQSIFVVLALFFSRAFVDYSTSGMENALSYFLVGCFVYVSQSKLKCRHSTHVFLTSLIWALAVCNRHDLALMLTPVFLDVLWQGNWRKNIQYAVLGLMPLLVWHSFALVYYGFLLPNTMYAKLFHDVPRWSLIAHSRYYFAASLLYDPTTLLLIVIAGSTPWFSRGNHRLKLISIGIGLYLLYLVTIGGDWMMGRFFSVPVFAAACILASVPKELYAPWRWLAVAVIIIAVSASRPNVPLLTTDDYGVTESWEEYSMAEFMLMNERMRFSYCTSLSRRHGGNDYPCDVWAQWGRALRKTGEAHRFTYGAVGMLGYYGGPKLHIVDTYGVTEPLLAQLPVLRDQPIRIAHMERMIPVEYWESLITGDNQIGDAELSALYDALTRISQGPIWSIHRWRDIVLLNLGVYQSRIKRDRYYWKPSEAVDLWHEQAQAHIAAGNVAQAKATYRDLLEFVAHDYRAYEYFSELFVAQDDLAGLVVEGEIMTARYPRRYLGHFCLGMAYERQGRIEDALAAYEQSLKLKPEEYVVRQAIAGALTKCAEKQQETGEWSQVISMLERAAAANPNPDDHAISFRLLMARAENSDVAQAKAYYREAIAVLADRYEAYEALSELYVQAGDLDGLRQEWASAVARYPDDYLAHFCLGLAYERQGRIEAALAAYEQSLALRPAAHGTKEAIARVLTKYAEKQSETGEWAQVIAILERAEAANPNPDDHAISFRLLMARAENSDVAQAKAYYREAIAVHGDRYEAYEALSELYVQAGDLDGLRQEWASAVARYPDNYLVYFCLGLACERQDRIEDALAAYEQSLELKPDEYIVRHALAGALIKYAEKQTETGEWTQVIAILERAEAANPNPDDHAISFRLLMARAENSDVAQAKAYYREAIAVHGDRYEAYEALSELYVQAGDLDGLRQEWASAVARYPDNYLAHFSLGLAYERQDRIEAALAAYEQSLALRPAAHGTEEAITRVRAKMNDIGYAKEP